MTDQNPFADDDTVLTEGHGTMDDTAPVRRVSPPDPQASIFRGRALPPQSPPVTDIHLLEFRLPETPSGTVARYRPRVGLEVTEIPEFDAEWRVRQRAPRDIAATDVVAHQLDHRRSWRRRAVVTVIAVAVVAIAAGVAAFWLLSRLP
jgi:hypothetical protein